MRVTAYTQGANSVTIYSDRWWGSGLRTIRVSTLRKHYRLRAEASARCANCGGWTLAPCPKCGCQNAPHSGNCEWCRIAADLQQAERHTLEAMDGWLATKTEQPIAPDTHAHPAP